MAARLMQAAVGLRQHDEPGALLESYSDCTPPPLVRSRAGYSLPCPKLIAMG